jgi:hypothetical protein
MANSPVVYLPHDRWVAPARRRERRRTAKTHHRAFRCICVREFRTGRGLREQDRAKARNLAGKFVAPHAVQFLAQPTCTPLTGSDPGPFPPGRIITDVLPVSALKLGDPVTISVDMVANDLSLHLNITTVEGEGAELAK